MVFSYTGPTEQVPQDEHHGMIRTLDYETFTDYGA